MSETKPTIESLLDDTAKIVHEKIEIAKRFIEASEAYLRQIGALSVASGSIPPAESPEWRVDDDAVRRLLEGLDIKGVSPPWKGVVAFLCHVKRPQPRKVIVRALILGEAKLGERKEKSVNQAISTNVGLEKPKLKEPAFNREAGPDPESLVGLQEWPAGWFERS